MCSLRYPNHQGMRTFTNEPATAYVIATSCIKETSTSLFSEKGEVRVRLLLIEHASTRPCREASAGSGYGDREPRNLVALNAVKQRVDSDIGIYARRNVSREAVSSAMRFIGCMTHSA